MSGKILIVDDVATNRIVLKVKLTEACYTIIQAECGATALQLAQDEAPDLILLDMNLPDMDGAEVCERLKANPQTRQIPIIILTALDDRASRLRALEAGADEFLTKTRDDPILPARLRSLLRARETTEELRLRESTPREFGLAEMSAAFERPGLVALVAGRKDVALMWKHRLEPFMTDHLVILSQDEALAEGGPQDRTRRRQPDVYLISAGLLGQSDGLRLLSELRSRPSKRNAGICILVEPGDGENAVMALDLGASDLLTNGTDAREMALRLRTQLRRKRQADRLRSSMLDGMRLAVTDPLTGLYNRRYALPHLKQLAERSGQTGKPFAVMVLDIDRFKTVNDTWGHAVGDAVLVEIATRLRDHLRPVDLVARIGGEEFLVALPDAPLGFAQIAAERLCQAVHDHPVQISGGPAVNVSMSIGLAIGGPQDARDTGGIAALMERADQAMLGAKADGRNQVAISRSAA